MTHTIKYFYAVFNLIFLIAFTGCKTSIKVKAENNFSTQLSFNINLGKLLTETIQNIAGNMSGMPDEKTKDTSGIVIFDKKLTETSLKKTELKEINVSIPEASSMSISAKSQNAKETREFVTCTKQKLKVCLSKETISSLAKTFPEETMTYLDLMMAPVLTGESMTSDEYIDLVKVIYGEKIAGEMENSTVDLELVSAKGKSEIHKIPLATFLTMNEPIEYEISNL